MFYAIRSSKIRGSKWGLAVKIDNFRKFRRHCCRLPVISWESKWRGWTGERQRKDHEWRLFSTTRWAVEDGLSGIDYPMWIMWYQPSIELHFWGPPSEVVQWLMIHQLRCGNLVFNLVKNLQLQRKSYTNLDKWMKIPSNLNMWYPIKQVKIDIWFFWLNSNQKLRSFCQFIAYQSGWLPEYFYRSVGPGKWYSSGPRKAFAERKQIPCSIHTKANMPPGHAIRVLRDHSAVFPPPHL